MYFIKILSGYRISVVYTIKILIQSKKITGVRFKLTKGIILPRHNWEGREHQSESDLLRKDVYSVRYEMST